MSETLEQEAQSAAAAGRLEQAVAIEQRAIAAHPRKAGLRVELAQWLIRLNRPLEAISACRVALALDPGNQAAELGLGAAYRAVFNNNEARKAFQEASRSHPASARPLLALADLELELQEYTRAEGYARQALKLAPHDPAAHIDLAVAYQGQGDLTSALAELNTALAAPASRDEALAYYLRGSLYADRNQNELALRDARQALELQPRNPRARSLVARIELRTGRCADAVTVLEPLASPADADSETLYLTGRALECAGLKERARQVLARFAKKSAQEHSVGQARAHADYLVSQAGEAARRNKLRDALDLLSRALAADPANSKAQAQLAKIYFSEGRIDLARLAIEKALASEPYQPDYLYVRGKVLERQGELNGALAAFRATVLIDPAESDAYYEIGNICLKQGRREEALAALKQALALSPADPDYRRTLEAAQAGSEPK